MQIQVIIYISEGSNYYTLLSLNRYDKNCDYMHRINEIHIDNFYVHLFGGAGEQNKIIYVLKFLYFISRFLLNTICILVAKI